MDFKTKFKNIVKKDRDAGEKPTTPIKTQAELNQQQLINFQRDLPTVANYIRAKELRLSQNEVIASKPELEDEILYSIDEIYFSKFRYESDLEEGEVSKPDLLILQKLPENLDLGYIIGEKTRLKKQLFVVSKKVSDLIVKNQDKYVAELQRVTELQTTLNETIKICTRSRNKFADIQSNCTLQSLRILSNHQRKEVLKNLLLSLTTIKNLQETDIKIKELLRAGDFSKAVQRCLECQKAAQGLKHFKCVNELAVKMQDTLEYVEEQVDGNLSKMCTNFNETVFEKLQLTFNLLGKTQSSIDQLFMHFASVIHNETFSVVYGYVTLINQVNQLNQDRKQGATEEEQLTKKSQFNELCHNLNQDCFIPCFIDLCKIVFNILVNYQKIFNWYEENNEVLLSTIDSKERDHDQMKFDSHFIKQRLIQGKQRVWQEIQQKIKIFLGNKFINNYSFDEFINILEIARKLMNIGQEFCYEEDSSLEKETKEPVSYCTELENKLTQLTREYFISYHKKSMDDLSVFLENEIWKLCPINYNFKVTQLAEFQFLINKSKLRTPLTSPTKANTGKSKFNKNLASNPFENIINEFKISHDEELMSANPNEEDSERLDSGDAKSKLHQGPLITLTTLSVLRLFGKYLQILNILNTISDLIMKSLFEIFNYYLISVYKFFCEEISFINEIAISNELRQLVHQINTTMIDAEVNVETNARTDSGKFRCPTLNQIVDLKDTDKLYGLPERTVGVESLNFLAGHLIDLAPNFMPLIDEDMRTQLSQYFDHTVVCAQNDLREPAYMLIAIKAIDFERVLQLTATINWNIKEIMSQHNSYVDLLLNEIFKFKEKLHLIEKSELFAKIPDDVVNLILEQILKLINRTFVEGFSNAKKCSNEGRALMQLDYQQYLNRINSVFSFKRIPEKEMVDEYIKAYYLNEESLVNWIKLRKEYTSKQLISLINCMYPDNKRTRGRLIALVENEYGIKTGN